METIRRHSSLNFGEVGSPISIALLVCLVAALSYFAPSFQWAVMLHPQTVWPLWPSCALLVAVLVLVPRRIWPILIPISFASIVLFDLQKGVPIGSIAWFIAADTIEVLIAALCLSYFFDGVPRLKSVKAVAKYLLFAVILAPSAAAFLAAPGITYGSSGDYWFGWRVSFFSDVLAFLTLTPAVLTWVSDGRAWLRKSLSNYLEAAAMFAALVVFASLTFVPTSHSYSTELLYSLVPCLLWSALRFGTIGVSTSIIAVMLLSVWGTVHGRGPFAETVPFDQVLSLQFFLFFTATPFMVLAALVEERRLADAELAKAHSLARLGSWRWDVATDTVTWSEELYRISGLDPKLPAPSYQDHPKFYTAESWDRLRHAVEEALRTGAPYQLDLEMVRTDGTKRWLFARGETQRDAQGHIVQLHGTVQDITERKQAEEMLSTMSRRLIEAHEEERAWIARELHDDFSQRVAMVSVNLASLEQNLLGSEVQAKSYTEEIKSQINELSSDIHALSHRLHSSKLDHLGLVAACQGFCMELTARQHVEIEFHSENIPIGLSKEISLCLFRVLQEALQNAVKYSGVRSFRVSLNATSDQVGLTVSDAGSGFDPDEAIRGQGLGLTSMKERLKLVDGQLSIESKPGQGTAVYARVPLSPETSVARASS